TVVTTARETPTIIVSNSTDTEKRKALVEAGVEIIVEDARKLSAVLSALRQRDIQSILVEGGTEVAGSFRDQALIDKLTIMIAPRVIGGNAPFAFGGQGASSMDDAPALRDISVQKYGEDIEITGYFDLD
ncbi:MAG TPA: RibD family protein, partial [Pyrinomonadaceae bacterium]|nr:RibD family protein [Pyrinomonadaceae bacterium]